MGEIPDEDGFMAKLAEDFARELAKMDSLMQNNAGFDPGNAEGEGGFQQSIRQTMDKLKASESTLKVRAHCIYFNKNGVTTAILNCRQTLQRIQKALTRTPLQHFFPSLE
jgi:hypothetical protein